MRSGTLVGADEGEARSLVDSSMNEVVESHALVVIAVVIVVATI